MFERLSPGARAALVNAYERARAGGTAELREEHLLAALLTVPVVDRLLGRMGWPAKDRPAALDEIARARQRGGISPLDAAALAEIGIDVAAVLARVEGELGSEALQDAPTRGWRPRSRPSSSAGAKQVLATAVRQARALGDHDLREEHLLLGILATRSVVSDVLGNRGVTVAGVLGVWEAPATR